MGIIGLSLQKIKKTINENRSNNRIKTNYFNNIHNNINICFNIEESQIYPQRKAIKYKNNAYLLRNKYHKKIREFNSI